MRILVDMDSIVADFMKGLWDTIEKDTGVRYDTSCVTTWDMGSSTPLGTKLFRYFEAPGFFENLEPVPGAIESLKRIQAAGHDVLIVTAPCTPHSASEKITWYRKYLNFLPKNNLMIAKRKELIAGDVLIDDSLENARAYKTANPRSQLLTISYPYNQDGGSTYNCRAEGYEDMGKAWISIMNFLEIP